MAIDTVNDALDEAIKIKGQIRTAIIGKEVAVPSDTPFEDYPEKINQIKGILQTKNITPTAVGGDVLPDSGYDGFSKVTLPAEPNLVAPNISEGVSIFGVTGTAQTATFSIAQFFARTLTTLSLGVPTIGDYTFYQNTTLQSFTDTALADLGSYAFYNCTGLTTVTTGSGLTDLEPYTFYGCTNLAAFDMTHIESIGDYALYNCNKLNNIGRLHVSEIGQYGCYSLASSASNGFVYDPTDPAEVADYGFQYAKINEIAGEIKSVGQYGFANLANGFTTISADFNGVIGNYGLYNNQYVKTVDFSNSNITNLGQYAFYYLGWNRANYSTDPYMQLDFRASTFGTVDQYAFSYIRYADIYLPSSVTQINNYAFQTCQYVNLFMQGPAPTLASTAAFNNTTSMKIYAPWTYLAGYMNGTNWSSMSSNIIGYAPAGTFAAGATLPQYNAEGYEVTWYSDAEKTTQITTCPTGSPMIYCTVGSTKIKQVVTVATTGPITLAITDSNNNPVDISYGFFLCNNGDVFTINATTLPDYTCFIKVGDTKVTSFPYVLTVGSSDISITGNAYDPSRVNPNFVTASWEEIKLAVDNGIADTLYASYVGSSKAITLTNGTSIHVRLANVAGALYDYASGGGSTGFVLEFVELYQTAQMNTSGTNNGGWNASYMRSTIMPQIYALLPSDLKEVIATVKTKSCYSGYDGTLVESEDTLFLPADPEIFGSSGYSRTEEKNALTRWQYYADNDTAAARIKNLNGSADNWWTRSPRQDSSSSFCVVNGSGSAYITNASSGRGVAPGFCI